MPSLYSFLSFLFGYLRYKSKIFVAGLTVFKTNDPLAL